MQRTVRAPSQIPWWKGARGEWYVVGQGLLGVLVAFGPRTGEGWTAWVHPYSEIAAIAGASLFLIGGLLFAAGIFKLGPNLSPVPFPKAEATLVETGPYGLVRHPMYSGAVMIALGWALWVNGWLTIGYAIALFLFFDIKSRREEKWLAERFPGYRSYQRRIRKLIPYIY
jgi:protein-S-isoprenylcysteine O-methyltransferase Ste14